MLPEEAFVELYEGERRRLSAVTARIAPDRAEDIVHDAFLTFLTRGDGVEYPRAWLQQVARNRALNHVTRNREVALDERSADAPADPIAPPAEGEALRELVADALGDLDDRSRLALLLRFFEERSYEDIAVRLKVRVRQAHVVVHRAQRRLGKALVRRLAAAHDASSCAPALEELMGLGNRANGHGADPCERCRPVMDELHALRSLGMLPPAVGMLWLRAGTDLATRAPAVTDVVARAGNTALAACLVIATAVAAPTFSIRADEPGRAASRDAAVVAGDEEREPLRTRSAKRASTRTDTTVPAPEPSTVADVGPVVVRSDDDHTHGEVNGEDGGTVGGVIVCEPFEPCPPPPEPGP